MAVRLKHSASIAIDKEGIRFGGSFALNSDELDRLEGKDIKRKIGTVKNEIHGRARSSIHSIGRKRARLAKISRKASGSNGH